MQVSEIHSNTPSVFPQSDANVLQASEAKGSIQSCADGIFRMIASIFITIKGSTRPCLNCYRKEVAVSDLAPSLALAKEGSQARPVPEGIQIAMDVQSALREGELTCSDLLKYFRIYVSSQQQKELYVALGLKAHEARGKVERLKAYWNDPIRAYQVNIVKDPEARNLELETKGRLLVEENPIQAGVIATLAHSLDSYISEGMQRVT